MKKYDIFLSYRRKGGWETAKHLYDLMTRDGYSVSFDIDTLREGVFDEELLRRIDECTDFIVILDEHVFDRTIDNSCARENDWLRIELAYAIEHEKNIIPIRLRGFNAFPDNLPDDIIKIKQYNAPKYDHYYFNNFYDFLLHKFIHSSPRTITYFLKKIPFNKIFKKLALAIVIFFACIFFAFIILILTSKNEENTYEINEVENVPGQKMLEEGEKYYYGKGVKQDYHQAVLCYQKAAEEENTEAIINLGHCYYNGTGVEKDYHQATLCYKKAAEEGNTEAMINLGYCYYFAKGVAQDYKQAVLWYQKAAEEGDSEAMYDLGYCYYYGTGVEKDYNEAAYWFQKAAEEGKTEAMFTLGNCYYFAKGVVQDYKQAVLWYQKAAEEGNTIAMFNLGYCYYRGTGVEKDYNEAVYWYQRAAWEGNTEAMIYLGYCYYDGIGVEQDYNQAVLWYQKAAEKGNADAMYYLGICYKNGNGVEKSKSIADKLNKAYDAAKAGDKVRTIQMFKNALK